MLSRLEEKLHNDIPMTKYMKLKIEKIENGNLITSIPLEPNINDKGTGFAGSLSTLVTISAWSSCYLTVEEELGFIKTMIAVIKSDTSYKAPITKDMKCITKMPKEEEVEALKKKLISKASASLKVKSQIIEDEKVCVEFEGIYVIKL